jgi:allantoinase
MKILKNILLSTGENKLRAADVFFSGKIKEVRFRSDEFEWKDVKEKSAKKTFIANVPKSNYPKSAEVIDGKWLLAIPGAVDAHVHFNTPGFEMREDFEHASFAAAFGGVTTVVDMPCTSVPPVTNLKNFRTKLRALKNRSYVDFAFWGGVGSEDLRGGLDVKRQIEDLASAGVVGFKVYTISGMEEFHDLTYPEIELVASLIRNTGKPMGVHAEDKSLVVNMRSRLVANGENSWEAYCKARSVRAESKAVSELIKIAGKSGARVHIVHLSSKAGLDKIIGAKKIGINISAETCPHYLYFTQDDFSNNKISAFLKTAPPVKFEKDKDALWKGLKNGAISFVTTDHAGCIPKRDKSSSNFWKVYGGIPGVEQRVPFLFSEGFLKGKISLQQTVDLLTSNPVEYYSLNGKGKIQPGFDADIALINLWKSKVVKSRSMHSKGKYTPFEGVEFNSVVEKTFLRGKQVVKNEFGGKFVKSKD